MKLFLFFLAVLEVIVSWLSFFVLGSRELTVAAFTSVLLLLYSLKHEDAEGVTASAAVSLAI